MLEHHTNPLYRSPTRWAYAVAQNPRDKTARVATSGTQP